MFFSESSHLATPIQVNFYLASLSLQPNELDFIESLLTYWCSKIRKTPQKREREHRYSIFPDVLGVSGVGESFMSHAVGRCGQVGRMRRSHAARL